MKFCTLMLAVFCIGSTFSAKASAQESPSLSISHFSSVQVKSDRPQIPWAFYHYPTNGYLAHDVIVQMENGEVISFEASEYDLRDLGANKYNGFTYRTNEAIDRVCYTNFRICASKTISSCRPLKEGLIFRSRLEYRSSRY